ncbi:hypothetical protein A0J61_10419 [Choanephora cucurbitarum]|uniref:F-box domain-containing protein n=1 Tax=Choanephora cucurbitarum TaxID=101091 RepID=A0A1C7MXH9_9FUNG|nr:hypothetical protein A0J61_10419 [Choanephora cucurbitarum]
MFSLPTEIVDQIIPYLSSKDYNQLIRVGRAYYSKFIKPLYQNITIEDSDKFMLFLKENAHHKHVRSIDMSHVYVDADQTERLSVLFPYLTHYNFELDMHNDDINFPQPFLHLVSLTIVVGYSEQPLLAIFAKMPSLESLYIVDMYYEELTVDLLSHIHKLCPYLKNLYIESFMVKRPTEEQFESLQLHNRLQTLVIRSYSLDHHYLWLRYVGFCCPNLEYLKLEDKLVSSKKPKSISYPAKFHDWFWSSCRRLIQFEAVNITPDDLFLKKLKLQQERLQ